MASKTSILEKVDFIMQKSISKNLSDDDINTIVSYTSQHSDNLIVGKVFGYSVSDYALASLMWIGTPKTVYLFQTLYKQISSERKSVIDRLIQSKLYLQY